MYTLYFHRANRLICPMDTPGHPYMQVQLLDKNEPEILADWLLDANLGITKLSDQASGSLVGKSKCAPAKTWHKSLEAMQVHYYSKKKYAFKHGNNISYIRNNEDSDSCKFKDTIRIAIHVCL
jgi:hypothetical protein